MFTPELELDTLFVLNDKGRIVSTREPRSSPGPRFALIRASSHSGWAVHASVPDDQAAAVERLAREEPGVSDFQSEPEHAERYASLLGGRRDSGPSFTFPDGIAPPTGATVVEDATQLQRHLRGWTADDIASCSPIFAIVEDGHAVSVCFCARRTDAAAEAGVETGHAFRGRGLAPRVTAAWALAIRASGRLPMYSTSWSSQASLAVARKLGLQACAGHWSLWEK